MIINEVSNGPSGNQEYVEFVVVDTAISYDCSTSEPPCIDIRGWIFDDNNNYHGSSGTATGCLRFSFDPLWSCVPLGTIIVIYNDADLNPLIPAIDLSLNDGNCSLSVPISNGQFFESNSTTPGDVACSYPNTGWVAGGNWNNVLLANTGDCARLVNLVGCEVFSVCWGSNNLNTEIYFSGGANSPTSASKTVYYFNGTDPNDQANWSIGCADPSVCGSDLQTPGLPNNPLNSTYISQFNNNCSPILPLSVSAVINSDADCGCNGEATASASGSIAGYNYEWFDNNFNVINQNTSTASNLCAGTYQVVATSSIGCQDTTEVIIASDGGISVQVNSIEVCEGDEFTLIAEASLAGGTYFWEPGGQTTNQLTLTAGTSETYTVNYTLNGCTANATATVTVYTNPTADFTADVYTGHAPLLVTFQNQSSSANQYLWTFGDGSQNSSNGATVSHEYLNEGEFLTTLIAINGICYDTISQLIQVLPPLLPSLDLPNVFTPDGDQINDYYSIISSHIETLEVLILNRWGNEMATFNDVQFKWDGNVNGMPASEGTYFIKYKAIAFDNSILEGHSFFYLIRK